MMLSTSAGMCSNVLNAFPGRSPEDRYFAIRPRCTSVHCASDSGSTLGLARRMGRAPAGRSILVCPADRVADSVRTDTTASDRTAIGRRVIPRMLGPSHDDRDREAGVIATTDTRPHMLRRLDNQRTPMVITTPLA